MTDRTYIAIDLKTFYASVECVERGLDPLKTNLVVADLSRTEKTICLAVSPSLKSYGISGRARLFEVVEKVREINASRLRRCPGRHFYAKSYDHNELMDDPGLELDYIVATPRMSRYMEVSNQVYRIYLKYIAPEDIHVYSVDEVFIDATHYLTSYRMTAREFTRKLISEVLKETGVTATAGIGTNLFLCKIAMDIVAKRISPDRDGVRIAELDEISYRKSLWEHRPITDFWRVGPGYARKLEAGGMLTMGDVARISLYDEDRLYKMFGVNAELLIDHAWGWEPTTIADIKAYRPENNSLSSGQVLSHPYSFDQAKIVVGEMTDALVLDLVEKQLVTDQMVLTVGYDIINVTDPKLRSRYKGPIKADYYGREAPKQAHGSINLDGHTSSTKRIIDAVNELYDRIVDKNLLIRRMYVVANHVITDEQAKQGRENEQIDLFATMRTEQEKKADEEEIEREKRRQNAIILIKKKYGKNAILKGTSLQEGATAKDRNAQVGGHRA